METVSTRIPIGARLVRGAAQWPEALASFPAAELGARGPAGVVVTDHRTSWVRRVDTTLGSFFVKTYEYATWDSRVRAALRHTGPIVRSRAAAEFDALRWMQERGLPAAEPLAVYERRGCLLLRTAILVTRAFCGEPVERLLPQLDLPARAELARAIGEFVGRLHALGFRDRNLDLRNLLAARDVPGGAWRIAKIDSGRHVLGRRAGDALARADWRRLLPQLEPYGVAASARTSAPPGI